jgi:hypothetical protein
MTKERTGGGYGGVGRRVDDNLVTSGTWGEQSSFSGSSAPPRGGRTKRCRGRRRPPPPRDPDETPVADDDGGRRHGVCRRRGRPPETARRGQPPGKESSQQQQQEDAHARDHRGRRRARRAFRQRQARRGGVPVGRERRHPPARPMPRRPGGSTKRGSISSHRMCDIAADADRHRSRLIPPRIVGINGDNDDNSSQNMGM